MTKVEVKDSWGHKLESGLKDTIEDQNLEINVPSNSKYFDLYVNTGYGGINEVLYNTNRLNVTGAETVSISTGVRFFPDWEHYAECRISFILKESDINYLSKDTNYNSWKYRLYSRTNHKYFWKIRRCL